MARNVLDLNGDTLAQIEAELERSLQEKIRDLQREVVHAKNLFLARGAIGEAEAKVADRYDLTLVSHAEIWGLSSSSETIFNLDSVRVQLGHSNSVWMDWAPPERQPQLKTGKYAVVIALKRIGDLPK